MLFYVQRVKTNHPSQKYSQASKFRLAFRKVAQVGSKPLRPFLRIIGSNSFVDPGLHWFRRPTQPFPLRVAVAGLVAFVVATTLHGGEDLGQLGPRWPEPPKARVAVTAVTAGTGTHDATTGTAGAQKG